MQHILFYCNTYNKEGVGVGVVVVRGGSVFVFRNKYCSYNIGKTETGGLRGARRGVLVLVLHNSNNKVCNNA